MKKRMGYIIFVAVLVVSLGYGFAPAPRALAAAAAVPQADDHAASVPGQLIVGFAPSVSLGSIATRAEVVAQAVGAKVLKTDNQSMALLEVGGQRNLAALELTIQRLKGVRYAEPNYVSRVVEPAAGSDAGLTAAPAMGGGQAPVSSTYPNDPSLLVNAGWQAVGADMVWNNTTPSKEVCLVDSGVDYLHKDLIGKIVKGPDFNTGDNDPMDDYGHGTLMAGIIAAIPNNAEGIAGVSTGKVLAVKAVDSSATATTIYDLAQGIDYCADQAGVSVLLTAWSNPDSNTLYTAIYHAVHDKGKLVVAAAGNDTSNSLTDHYPAAYSMNFPEVVAVASSGYHSGSTTDYTCMESDSNYGSWITLAAPGYGIYTTTPWDKPFTADTSIPGRYAVSPYPGSESAAAFVAAAAARVWGYLPTESAAAIVQRLQATGNSLKVNGTCWPNGVNGMPSGLTSINVASAMDRGAAILTVEDALTDLPIPGAKVTVYNATTNALLGSAVVPSGPTLLMGPNISVPYPMFVQVINLPAGALSTPLIAKVSATNYTASPQNAFVVRGTPSTTADGEFTVGPGEYSGIAMSFVPPKSANFAAVGLAASVSPPHLAAWVPSPPASEFIVSDMYSIPDPNSLVLPWGSLYTDPYARWMRNDQAVYEALLIRNRTSDTSAPWYTGNYWVGLTDKFTSGTNYLDNNNASVMVWKDGVIKARVDKGTTLCGPNAHWWFPLQIVSPASGAATYVKTPTKCGTMLNDAPYHP